MGSTATTPAPLPRRAAPELCWPPCGAAPSSRQPRVPAPRTSRPSAVALAATDLVRRTGRLSGRPTLMALPAAGEARTFVLATPTPGQPAPVEQEAAAARGPSRRWRRRRHWRPGEQTHASSCHGSQGATLSFAERGRRAATSGLTSDAVGPASRWIGAGDWVGASPAWAVGPRERVAAELRGPLHRQRRRRQRRPDQRACAGSGPAVADAGHWPYAPQGLRCSDIRKTAIAEAAWAACNAAAGNCAELQGQDCSALGPGASDGMVTATQPDRRRSSAREAPPAPVSGAYGRRPVQCSPTAAGQMHRGREPLATGGLRPPESPACPLGGLQGAPRQALADSMDLEVWIRSCQCNIGTPPTLASTCSSGTTSSSTSPRRDRQCRDADTLLTTRACDVEGCCGGGARQLTSSGEPPWRAGLPFAYARTVAFCRTPTRWRPVLCSPTAAGQMHRGREPLATGGLRPPESPACPLGGLQGAPRQALADSMDLEVWIRSCQCNIGTPPTLASTCSSGTTSSSTSPRRDRQCRDADTLLTTRACDVEGCCGGGARQLASSGESPWRARLPFAYARTVAFCRPPTRWRPVLCPPTAAGQMHRGREPLATGGLPLTEPPACPLGGRYWAPRQRSTGTEARMAMFGLLGDGVGLRSYHGADDIDYFDMRFDCTWMNEHSFGAVPGHPAWPMRRHGPSGGLQSLDADPRPDAQRCTALVALLAAYLAGALVGTTCAAGRSQKLGRTKNELGGTATSAVGGGATNCNGHDAIPPLGRRVSDPYVACRWAAGSRRPWPRRATRFWPWFMRRGAAPPWRAPTTWEEAKEMEAEDRRAVVQDRWCSLGPTDWHAKAIWSWHCSTARPFAFLQCSPPFGCGARQRSPQQQCISAIWACRRPHT